MRAVLLTVSVLIFAMVSLFAGVPNEINYNGRLKEYNQPVTGTRTMCFKIYDAAGSEKWSSGNVSVVVNGGIFNYKMAPNIDWRGGDFYIETIISDKILSPREKILSSFYAMHSKTAEDVEKPEGSSIHFAVGSSTYVVISSNGNVGIGTTSISYKLDVNGDIRINSGGKLFFGDGSSMNTAGSGSAVSISNNSDAAIMADVDNNGTGGIQLKVSGNEYMSVTNSGKVGIGVTNPSTKLQVDGEIKSLVSGTTFYMVPRGAIIMWSGAINTIPSGWQLCDGTNGTPNLLDRFILSVANSSENPGSPNGSHTKTITESNLPSHTHTATCGNQSSDHTHSGTTSTGGTHSHSIGRDDRANAGTSVPLAADRGVSASVACNTSSDGSHQHTITTGGISVNHNHSVAIGYTGSGQAIDIRPAYYKLAFIMKL